MRFAIWHRNTSTEYLKRITVIGAFVLCWQIIIRFDYVLTSFKRQSRYIQFIDYCGAKPTAVGRNRNAIVSIGIKKHFLFFFAIYWVRCRAYHAMDLSAITDTQIFDLSVCGTEYIRISKFDRQKMHFLDPTNFSYQIWIDQYFVRQLRFNNDENDFIKTKSCSIWSVIFNERKNFRHIKKLLIIDSITKHRT